MARAALELIGQSGFGYSFDNMTDDQPKHKYSIVIKDLVYVCNPVFPSILFNGIRCSPTLGRLGFATNYILPWAVKLLNAKVRTFIMNMTPWKTLHEIRDMVNYMHELSVEIYQEKKRALEEGDEAVERQIGKGKDILSILCKDLHFDWSGFTECHCYVVKENLKADDEDQLPESEVIAQVCPLF
jgi:hypothetical protein